MVEIELSLLIVFSIFLLFLFRLSFSIIGDLNMIRNPDIPAGCASIAFMEYRNIPKYIHSMDDERKIQLSSQLMRFMQIDMRRSSLFIMETSCLVHEEEC